MATDLPTRALIGCLAIVATSTLLFPIVTGYGTILFQLIVLNAWGAVADVSSGSFADRHHTPAWILAGLINLAMFSVPALRLYLPTRTRWPRFTVVSLWSWLGFYVLALFVLFPATDGP